MRRYVISIEVVVTDEDVLINAGRVQHVLDGGNPEDIDSADDALRSILDIGSAAFDKGFEIEDSSIEGVYEP